MSALLALLTLLAQDPAPDDIDAAFPLPVPAERQWEVADAYARRIAERVAAGDVKSVPEWFRRAWRRLPKGHGFSMHIPGSGPAFRKQAIQFGVRLGGRGPFTESMIKEASDEDLHFATHLAWIRMCEEGMDAGCREFVVLTLRLANVGQDYWAKRHLEMIDDLKKTGEGPEFILKLARHLGGVSDCPAASYSLLRNIRGRLALETAGLNRALLWEAGATVLTWRGDEAGAAAWKDRAIDEPGSGEIGARLLLERSNEHFKGGDLESAERGFRRLVDNWPTSPNMGPALYNLGYTLRKRGMYAEARAVFDRLMRSNANDMDPGGELMEYFRNYRPKAVYEIAACWEAEGRWDMALEIYETLGREYPMKSFSGTAMNHYAARRAAKLGRAQVETGRYEEAFATYAGSILDSGWGASSDSCVGLVKVAIKLGRLGSVIERFKPGDNRMHEILVHLRAIRFWARGELEGLLSLLSDGASARFWRELDYNEWREEDEGRYALSLEIVELAGSLGPWIIDPLLARTNEDTNRLGWTSVMIASVRSARSRAIVEGDRSDLKPLLLRISTGPFRSQPLNRVDLESTEALRALDQAIIALCAKIGVPPPVELNRNTAPMKVFLFLAVIVLLAAAGVVTSRIRVARRSRAG